MSLLRLLSPSRQATSSSPQHPTTQLNPTLRLWVPNYATIYLQTPPSPDPTSNPPEVIPQNDYMMSGYVEVCLPEHVQRARYKAIRVVFVTFMVNDRTPDKQREQDIIFERKVEILAGNSEGLYLEKQSSRFDFTLIIPQGLPAHDFHSDCRIRHLLYAEIEGIVDIAQPRELEVRWPYRSHSSLFPNSTRKTTRSNVPNSRSRSGSPASSRSSGSPTPPQALISASMSIIRQETDTLQTPSYETSEYEWIKGVYDVSRTVMVIYNPHPSGGVTILDERATGTASGLGVWEIRLFSDVWTVGGTIRTHLVVDAIPPETTIYYFRLLLRQTHSITSSRDESREPVTTTKTLDIVDRGLKPSKGHRLPSISAPSLWRGSGVGGGVDGELVIDAVGRVPGDHACRPSTLAGVKTFIHVSHMIVAQIYFTVWGEDDEGRPMARQGPGGLRVMQFQRSVVVPSCNLVPDIVDLPTYQQISRDRYRDDDRTVPCPGCGYPPSEAVCTKCPAHIAPHIRHDLDPKKISAAPDGECILCSMGVMSDGGPGHRACACGVKMSESAARLERWFREDAARVDPEDMLESKEDAERGRQGRS